MVADILAIGRQIDENPDDLLEKYTRPLGRVDP